MDDAAPGAGELIRSDGDLLILAATGLSIDAELFRSSLAAARRARDVDGYGQALDLYQGDVLPDDRYEDWADAPRRELNVEFRFGLGELAGLLEAGGDLGMAIEVMRRLVHASLGSRSGALAWQRRAELAACRGAHDKSAACLRRASGIATVSPMACHLWGRIHATAALSAIEQGDPERAVLAIQAAAAAAARYGDCATCSALINPVAAEALALLGDPDSARGLRRRCGPGRCVIQQFSLAGHG